MSGNTIVGLIGDALAFCGYNLDEVMGSKRRSRTFADLRSIVWYIYCAEKGVGPSAASRVFDWNRCTIHCAVARVPDLRHTDREFSDMFDAIHGAYLAYASREEETQEESDGEEEELTEPLEKRNTTMEVRFMKLVPEAVAPQRAHPTDAGFDLVATSISEDRIKGIVSYGTGLAVEIPTGYVGLLFPRSSVYKVQLQLANSVGVIDSGYRGEIVFKYRVVQPHIRRFSTGERVGQLLILPAPEIAFKEAETLAESDRGEGGFGSTGK